VAYFIGYVATMIPMPAGLAVLDTGLAGALVAWLPTRARALTNPASEPEAALPASG
jgi:hypothetical protein